MAQIRLQADDDAKRGAERALSELPTDAFYSESNIHHLENIILTRLPRDNPRAEIKRRGDSRKHITNGNSTNAVHGEN